MQCAECVENQLRVLFGVDEGADPIFHVDDLHSRFGNDYRVAGSKTARYQAKEIEALLDQEASIVVIDMPTLGLENQKSGPNLVTNRDGKGRPVTGLPRNLFDYVINAGGHGQLIILNNTDATPTSAFATANTVELIFGAEEDADRSGFLAKIREENGTLFSAEALEQAE